MENWLLNFTIITVSFLLFRVIIDSNEHHYYLNYFFKKSQQSKMSIISSILLISYVLSLFFPNNVIVLAMVPIVREISKLAEKSPDKKLFVTNLGLALIYGANIGGMGSLIGASLNWMSLGYMEFLEVQGIGHINFFTWLLFGIPVSMVLIFLSRLVLKIGEKDIILAENEALFEVKTSVSQHHKIGWFFIANLSFIILLAASQFIFKYIQMTKLLVVIDIIAIIYLCGFIGIGFVYPKKGRHRGKAIRNMALLGIYLILFLGIFVYEAGKEIFTRFKIQNHALNQFLEDYQPQQLIKTIWSFLFNEELFDQKNNNNHAYISINRIVYDLPFFGLFLVIIVFTGVFLFYKTGSPKLIIDWFTQFLSLRPELFYIGICFLVTVFMAIFFTEIVSNTTVIIIIYPFMVKLFAEAGLDPIYNLLALSIAASGTFMTPIATSVNTICCGSFQGFSLKRMVLLGLLMNVISAVWIAAFFFGLNWLANFH